MQNLAPKQIQTFQQAVIRWHQKSGRKQLPWQQPATAYRVWISEIMLQQTQVDTVISYFEKFIQRFPDIESLASAEIDEVMHLWSGLGYYARARNIHKTAQLLSQQHSANLPDCLEQLESLPGIGRSTAGAIASLGFKQSAPILDGNVKRVLARSFAVAGWSGKSAVQKQLWQLSECLTPEQNCGQYNQAMMDIGALICKGNKPDCGACPVASDCEARINDSIALYPGKKPAKKKPQKQQQFYFIQDPKGKILLYQRPPVGIWGGLWCLPDPEQLEEIALKAPSGKQITTFSHQFSHFTLNATITAIKPKKLDQIMDAANWSWYDPSDPAKIGMPAPFISFLQNQF
jgi:A/G-specific adenine glycosylase